MKIVINGCHGGFSLSDDAIREYLRRTGREWVEAESEYKVLGGVVFKVAGDEGWYDRRLSRTDPVLVSVVEDLGERAHGDFAYLEVHELPKGTHYRIREYDGLESIETRDEIEWEIA